MFRKELTDTARLVLGILIFMLCTVIFSFVILRLAYSDIVTMEEFLPPAMWLGMPFIIFYLGASIFSREKNGGTFEYFFSLPVSRWRALVYKIAPRLLAVLAFIVLYSLVHVIFRSRHALYLSNAGFLSFVVLSIFLFAASTSLLHIKESTSMLSGFFSYSLLCLVLILVVGGMQVFTLHEMFMVVFMILGLLGLALFAGFALRFKKFDMNNMVRLCRKNFLQVILPVPAVILLLVLINLADTGQPAGAFTKADLIPVTYDKSNGFYRLWTLPEPPGTDIQSDEVILKYRRLSDPAFDNKKALEEWDHSIYRKMSRDVLGSIRTDFDRSNVLPLDFLQRMEEFGADIDRIKQNAGYMLERYQQLIDTPVILDFSLPRWDTPIFNHLAWLRVGKFYVLVNALEAVKGNWRQGVGNILDSIQGTQRVTAGCRVLITDLVGKALARFSLQVLAALMNREDCPETVFKQILDGLPPLEPGDFRNRNTYIAEYLAVSTENIEGIVPGIRKNKSPLFIFIGERLFFQKNRTNGYVDQHLKKIIELENTPPYQWESDPLKIDRRTGAFWWVVNPFGKVIGSEYGPSYIAAAQKTHLTLILYDLTRMAAEFHLKYQPGQSVEEVLKGLDTYNALKDPGSGQPYRWNEKKRLLYSIGVDGQDNGGRFLLYSFSGIDFALPVRVR
jgi:ABC-type transport system involved in multi-copper enzyme maturation permease subunit